MKHNIWFISIFVLRRNVYTSTNEFCYTMYIIFWYAPDVKYSYENKTMHCHCRTDTSTTVDINKP